MEFSYQVKNLDHGRLREFLKAQGISKSLLAKVKFQGGKIYVNGKIENVLYELKINDVVKVVIPKELPHETVLLDNEPLDILYEDDHFLVVNKPSLVASIPSQYHPNGTMANRVKNYYVKNNYENQVIHVVTRLDRDTTGAMLFAKHGFAHALLDQELRKKEVDKFYYAYVSGSVENLKSHSFIAGNIARDLSSLLKREVVKTGGKEALTEYWLEEKKGNYAKVKLKLHTGRTHQIRVHLSSLSCPLLGDDLYGGSKSLISRQSLHCASISFYHPFLQQRMTVTCPLPQDLEKLEGEIFE